VAVGAVRPADIDESHRPAESPVELVERLAREKAARTVHPGELVLGADTVVVVDGEILGKPVDRPAAGAMLALLSGRRHDVVTGVAVADRRRGSAVGIRSGTATTSVSFRTLTASEINAYVEGGEGLDKAGAYGIQGGGGAFVESISGRYDTVVGLPLDLAVRLLDPDGALGESVATSIGVSPWTPIAASSASS